MRRARMLMLNDVGHKLRLNATADLPCVCDLTLDDPRHGVPQPKAPLLLCYSLFVAHSRPSL